MLHQMSEEIHPIHRLPSEILANIFVFCLPNRVLSYPRNRDLSYFTPALDAAPLSLCNVCSFWRSLATSTPQLWRQFLIIIATPRVEDQTHTDRIVEFIHTWLRRAGALPLSIYFDCRRVKHTTERRLYAALWEYASRWENIAIFLQSPFASWSRVEDLPLLHTLRITGDLNPDRPVWDVPFDSAPRLRILTPPGILTTPTAIPGIP